MPGFRGLLSKAVAAVKGAWEHAIFQGAPVTEVRQTAQETAPAVTAEELGAIISSVNEVAAAIDAIHNADPNTAVNADMIAVPTWAPEGRVAGSGGPYQIRIPYTNPGEEEGTISGWISKNVMNLPSTVGTLESWAQNELDNSISPLPTATLASGTHILAI